MFVGKDVLADKSGDLEVVQWGGYMAKVKKYQGSLLNKEAVLKRFDNKETSNLEDWDDLKFLWDYIIQNLSEL